MKITYLSDYHYFNETIVEGDPVVVQVGVADIFTLKKARSLYPKAKLIAYEADPNNFDNVKKLASDEKLSVKFVNKAVCGKVGDVTLHRYENFVSHSLLDRPDQELVEDVVVKSVNIASVFKSNRIKKIDILVLNCEGSELEILNDIFSEPDLSISQICVSFHCPRIYPIECRDGLLKVAGPNYHIIQELRFDGIPDHLLIRKV